MSKAKKHGLVGTLLLIVLGILLSGALLIVGANFFVVKTGEQNIVPASQADDLDAQCILVLGASVLPDGTPSGILEDRLDVGVDLYLAGVAPKMIMSGDNGTESYNEVLAMKNYAVAKGVPSEDIFCDHAGFSTYESMYRAQAVFGVERMVVVTQTYHLYRALSVANGLGMEARGVASDLHEYQNQQYYNTREIPARIKDIFQTAFHTPPTFTGDPISLNQSGDAVD